MDSMTNYFLGKALGSALPIVSLIGLTLRRCVRDGNEVHLYSDNGLSFSLGNPRDAEIEDICGELEHLVGLPIIMAEQEESSRDRGDGYDDMAWYYYKLATVKGYVTIRFACTDGYYASYAELTWVEDLDGLYLADDYEVSYDGTQIFKLKPRHGGKSLEYCRERLKSKADEAVAACEKNIKELSMRIERARNDLRRLEMTELPGLIGKAAMVDRVPVVDRS